MSNRDLPTYNLISTRANAGSPALSAADLVLNLNQQLNPTTFGDGSLMVTPGIVFSPQMASLDYTTLTLPLSTIANTSMLVRPETSSRELLSPSPFSQFSPSLLSNNEPHTHFAAGPLAWARSLLAHLTDTRPTPAGSSNTRLQVPKTGWYPRDNLAMSNPYS